MDTHEAVPENEFAILAEEAAARGLRDRVPSVRRIGTQVSGLLWGESPRHIVALHGVALNAHTWDATLLHWGVPALALDLPGHGDSAWVDERPIDPTLLSAKIGPALDRAVSEGELERPLTLVGQSLGGLIALELAAVRDDVATLVLVDILPEEPGASPDPSPVADIAAFLAGPAEFPSREVLVQAALSFGLGGADPEGVRRAVTHNTRIRPDGRVEWKHQIARLQPGDLSIGSGVSQWEAVATFPGSIGLVAGTRGIVTEPQVDHLRRVRPDARVTRLEAGHNIQEDAPEALARMLEGLIGS